MIKAYNVVLENRSQTERNSVGYYTKRSSAIKFKTKLVDQYSGWTPRVLTIKIEET